jgi:mRNA interferase MazF
MYKPGDIVLALFPFTDLSASKRRPCVILALSETPGDLIVAFVTTGHPARFPRFGIAVDPTHLDWKQTRLKAASVIRLDRIATINNSITSGRLGAFSSPLRIGKTILKVVFGI